jgi:hypothetical protein
MYATDARGRRDRDAVSAYDRNDRSLALGGSSGARQRRSEGSTAAGSSAVNVPFPLATAVDGAYSRLEVLLVRLLVPTVGRLVGALAAGESCSRLR